MNYHNMIEPYLHGTLSPEDEVAFERQLSRDPALVEAAGRRLNAEEALAGIPEYRAVSHRPSAARTLLFVGLVAMLLGLLWWKMRPVNERLEGQTAPAETPVSQSEVPSH
ncbi:MAG TPA: hypothetical protein PK228_22125 [Saprospiraceae bacterium]|nr:hypothetical protein [Saprospiraceae bacterium]